MTPNEKRLRLALEKILGLHERKQGLIACLSDARELLLELYPIQLEQWGREVEWRSLPNYPMYEISNYGDLKRTKASRNNRYPAGTRVHSSEKRNGYLQYVLTDEHGNRSYQNAHRLVALAFLGKPPFKGAVVAHLDGSRKNNWVGNLVWTSTSVNQIHRARPELFAMTNFREEDK